MNTIEFLLIDVHAWQEGAQALSLSIFPRCKEMMIRGGEKISKNILLFSFDNPKAVTNCLQKNKAIGKEKITL